LISKLKKETKKPHQRKPRRKRKIVSLFQTMKWKISAKNQKQNRKAQKRKSQQIKTRKKKKVIQSLKSRVMMQK